jgi:ATP-dependent helicase/nuclease subunit B
MPTLFPNKITQAQKRNREIRGWMDYLESHKSEIINHKIIVCGSTASVPATADLMAYIGGLSNGYVILPGKIRGRIEDFEQDTNPYNSEYKFLKRIGVSPDEVEEIDVGASDIDFFNAAFGNTGCYVKPRETARLIECARESEEAECVAEIAQRAVIENKSILVITPDAAGNQRIAAALSRRNIAADFSGGRRGAMTPAGRAILNRFDDWIEAKDSTFDGLYKNNEFDLFKTIAAIVEILQGNLAPEFRFDSDESAAVWEAFEKMSRALSNHKIALSLSDARAVISDALSGVSVRPPMDDRAGVSVLGTIESRLQTADVVILTGLNEGMFPGAGYGNSWLPRATAEKIGLPSQDRKASLMALDFMNLSCAAEAYWLRSKTAGSSQTTESRFLSRVDVARRGMDRTAGADILVAVRARDDVPYDPLDYSFPRPPADKSDVYVTELELLIHNPYAFYARHILRLYPMDDYWKGPDARDFGNLVHAVVERAQGWPADKIVAELDADAQNILPTGSVLFHFWHKRFVEIAPLIEKILSDSPDAGVEIKGQIKIAGRVVRAKADRIWDGVVLDIKTGAAPSKRQLEEGNMPQLPLEAYIMQNGGFPVKGTQNGEPQTNVALQFLQLRNNDARLIEYDFETAQKMIDAAVDKISRLFGRYANDCEPYEYRETSDQKYKAYDDLARADD